MTDVSQVPLGEVATFIRGITFKPEDVIDRDDAGAVECMRTKNVQSELDTEDVLGIPARFVNRQEQFLQEEDILVSSANSWNLLGKCSWVPRLHRPTTLGGFITALRAHQGKLIPRYLYHWFNSPMVQTVVRSCGRQTTNISNLDLERCRKLLIPLPAFEEQRRIAVILDQAEALRSKRRQALAKLDTLTQSLFLEMFGDPRINCRRWPTDVFGNVGVLDRGVSQHRPRNAPELLGGIHPLVQTGEITRCDGYIHSFKNTYSDLGLKQSRLWPAGTLCITIAANIANTGVLTFPACFPDSVVGFTPHRFMTVEYVQTWMSFMQKLLEDSAPAFAQKNINLAILKALIIPVPPIDLQRSFSHRRDLLVSLRNCQCSAQVKEHTLFASLQHRAFNGEL